VSIKFFKEECFLGYARIILGTDSENARLMNAVKEAWPHDQTKSAAGGEVV